jgi:hypothetical protein
VKLEQRKASPFLINTSFGGGGHAPRRVGGQWPSLSGERKFVN